MLNRLPCFSLVFFLFLLNPLNPMRGYTEEPSHILDIDLQESGVAKIHAELFIEAPPKQVFHILTDYEHWPTLFPEGFQIELFPCSEECSMIADMIIPNALIPWTTHLRAQSREYPPHTFELHLIEGDYLEYQLIWKFAPTDVPKQTHATMNFTLQPQKTITDMIPDFLYEWAIRKGLEDHFDKIRQQVKATSHQSVPTSP